ncbi:MAG: HAD family hydrolase [Oscillospiraceae bacterium]|nr:HAD family hydrolase [Oscillospiraceae bacterium]
MIKLIASDLDGTIIDSHNNISKDNFEAIKAIRSKDIDFVVCTGKTYPIIKEVCSTFNATYGIFGNGNQIINLKTGEEIYKKLLTSEEIVTCLELAKKKNLHVHLYTDNEIITEKLLYMDLRNFKLKESNYYKSSLEFKVVKDIREYLSNNSVDVCKLVISDASGLGNLKEEILDQVDVETTFISKRGQFKDTTIDKEYEYLDISPKGINKNSALSILGNYLKVDKSDMMAIGDNLNDLEMIRDSGLGVAVSNAYDEVKSVAKYTTVSPVEKGGFAEAVYKFVEL